VDKSTNGTPNFALLTDESLYASFPSGGKRITAVAFDFGDTFANDLLERLAAVAGATAATNSGGTAAATSAFAAKADVETAYKNFVGGSAFRTATLNAALAAKIGAVTVVTNAAASFVAATNAVAGNSFVVNIRSAAVSNAAVALFPDARYVAAVDAISLAAAQAAASAAGSNLTTALVGASATNAALRALTNALNVSPLVSGGYNTFIGGSAYASAAALASAAAVSAAAQAVTDGKLGDAIRLAGQAAALKALTDASVFKTADKIVNTEVQLDGQLVPDGTVSGTLFLGANHPTNPFMHRRHTDHSTGYNLTRHVRIQVDSASSSNALAFAGFGVDRLTGAYREEIFGLHKPLGPNQDLGLLTEGVIILERLTTVPVLNQ
jgi:hypothetical protein